MQKWSRIARSLRMSGTPVEEIVMNVIANIITFPMSVFFFFLVSIFIEYRLLMFTNILNKILIR